MIESPIEAAPSSVENNNDDEMAVRKQLNLRGLRNSQSSDANFTHQSIFMQGSASNKQKKELHKNRIAMPINQHHAQAQWKYLNNY